MPLSQIFNVANMPFNAIRENKILTNISEFTVSFQLCNRVKYILFCSENVICLYHNFFLIQNDQPIFFSIILKNIVKL